MLWHEPSHTDLLFVTLNKSEALFSPTSRTKDDAISPWELHWESQSLPWAASPAKPHPRGSAPSTTVNNRGVVTKPFHCLGFAEDVSHEGERPMAIRWRLQQPIPAAFVPEQAVAV